MTNIINLTTTGGAKPNTTIDSPMGSTPQPEVDASEASLESRINTRRAELIFKLTELRASMHLDSVEAGDKVKARLSELSHIVKEGVVDGWGSLGDTVKRKLDRWLDDSARQLVAQPKSGQS